MPEREPRSEVRRRLSAVQLREFARQHSGRHRPHSYDGRPTGSPVGPAPSERFHSGHSDSVADSRPVQVGCREARGAEHNHQPSRQHHEGVEQQPAQAGPSRRDAPKPAALEEEQVDPLVAGWSRCTGRYATPMLPSTSVAPVRVGRFTDNPRYTAAGTSSAHMRAVFSLWTASGTERSPRHQVIASSKSAASTSDPAGRGDSVVRRRWRSAPWTSAGMSARV